MENVNSCKFEENVWLPWGNWHVFLLIKRGGGAVFLLFLAWWSGNLSKISSAPLLAPHQHTYCVCTWLPPPQPPRPGLSDSFPLHTQQVHGTLGRHEQGKARLKPRKEEKNEIAVINIIHKSFTMVGTYILATNRSRIQLKNCLCMVGGGSLPVSMPNNWCFTKFWHLICCY